MAKIKFGKRAKKVGDKASTPAPSVPLWMQTYSDFVTLLLTFFVMLLATMSESVNDSSIELIVSAFEGAFGAMPGGSTLSESTLIYGGADIETLPSDQRGFSTADGEAPSVSEFESELSENQIEYTQNERGYIITIGADQYFLSGSDEIIENEQTVETFIKLARLLSTIPNDIKIEGHTDSGAFAEGSRLEEEFGSNWGLSSARAIAVLETLFKYDLEGSLNRDQFSVVGFADTRPIANNDLPNGRALNRRVDIVILRDDITYYNQR